MSVFPFSAAGTERIKGAFMPYADYQTRLRQPVEERLARLNGELRHASATTILRASLVREWAGKLTYVSSFGAESAVMLSLIADVDPDFPVVFLETGLHFPQTLDYKDELIDRLGLTNAQLEAYAETGDSSVTDPVTGRTRIFSDRRHEEWYVEFRQDFPDRQFSYGFDYYQGGEVELYFIDEVRTFENGAGDLDIFVETTRIPGVTVRLSVDNIGDVVADHGWEPFGPLDAVIHGPRHRRCRRHDAEFRHIPPRRQQFAYLAPGESASTFDDTNPDPVTRGGEGNEEGEPAG
jgi:hypothetical protein